MRPLEIAYRSPARLHPHPRNARDHSDAQIDKIAASIRSFGFNSPVLVDAGQQIIAGHGRVLAAIKLGLDRIPTVAIEHLSEAQRRAFRRGFSARPGELAILQRTCGGSAEGITCRTSIR